MQTRDLDQATAAVTKVYCPHTVDVTGAPDDLNVTLEVSRLTSQPLVALSYGVPVAIDAGNFPRLFLMMHALRGAARTRQDGSSAEWGQGQTIPFSAGLDTQLWFDRKFAQQAIRLNVDQMEALCARLLGRPLREPLRFALRPFSEQLEETWRRTLAYLWSSEMGGLRLPAVAKPAFDEFLLTLLLTLHPHNYSGQMEESVPAPVPGVVRRAERLMVEHAEMAITVSEIASRLDISLRSLQLGFRQWRNTTPAAQLRRIRLERARDHLQRGGDSVSVTDIAIRCGFAHLGRFSAYYQSAFGEPPSATLRRHRPAGTPARRRQQI